MRDYNAIQFRSPSDKQKQTVTSALLPNYSPGLISTVRSTSLSPIPRVVSSNEYATSKMNAGSASQERSPSGGGGGGKNTNSSSNYSGVTSTTVVSSSSAHSNNANLADAIQLPYLENDNQPLQQQQSSSIASTNVMTNTTSNNNSNNNGRLNQASSPPQRSSNNKSYRTTSFPAEFAIPVSPTPISISSHVKR